MNRRQFLHHVGWGALGVVTGGRLSRSVLGQTGKATGRKPNLLLIVADDLGYGDLGCYGQKLIKTPNLDRLAAEGVRFTQCYAGSTVCAPSRCCLMTGLHTGHARVRGNSPRVPLRPEDVTVAEVLKRAGYVTGIIGKWGLGEPDTTGIPNRQGFDEWFGYLNQRRAHNYYPEYLWRNREKYWLEKNKGGEKGTYSHDLFTQESLNFIKRYRDRPFFLYLAYTIPHANNELGRVTGNGMEVPTDEPYSHEPWPQVEKNFAAMVTRLDRDVGRIMALLEELGLDRDTVIFFTSDNGPHREGGHNPNFFRSSGPLRGIKRDLYEGGIRMPMIVRWPGKIKPGSVSDQVWAFWDFLPTAAEIGGVEAPAGMDGISMLPALLGKPTQNHEYLYWEFYERGFQQAVRMGEWKGVRLSGEGPIELYHLSSDLGEEHNVADQHPDIVAKIAEIMKGAHTDSQDFPIRPKPRKR
ncbi:MAG TPA: N-acetylgalactosamine-6-sulfatase [Armatimonadetes bacterium]|nr:N-acetylgalactosamine-6-sulfatase [Armatimonadota bacterium]